MSFAVVLILGNASSLLACMCGKSATCERFNYYGTIFLGKATKVEKEKEGSLTTETTVFEIEEMFSGERVRSIGVQNRSGFSCDVEFTIGETYLVFAAGNKADGFGTGYCSGNLPLEYASQEISELRKLSGSTGNGRLLGTVLEESTKRLRDEKRQPLGNVRMEITDLGTGRKYSASTNALGRYEASVPPGKYAVTPVAPPSSIHTSLFEAEPMTIKSGGCSEGFFVFANNSMVAGRLLDAEGSPARNVRVELVSVDEKSSYLGGESDETDSNGYFSVKEIPAGKYTLSVNFNSNPDPEKPFPTTFYPSSGDRAKATILEIGFGSRIEGFVWNLPPKLAEKRLSGNVVWEDGSPAVGAEIKLFDMAFPRFYAGCSLLENRDNAEDTTSPVRSTSFRLSGPACDLKSNSSGAFRLSGYEGRTYRISASVTKTIDGKKIEYNSKSEPISPSGDSSTVKLILKTAN
ncbi:MAG: hypothetical protein AB7J13_01790 [Pyrinomonadaceae bacterium]